MKRLSLLALLIGAAVVSALLLKRAFWEDNRAALLVMLSVIAAGTLVRLARGLPFTSPDHYELTEIRALTKAVKEIMAKLRTLVVMVVATMALLILAYPFVGFICRQTGWAMGTLEAIASAILGAMHTYAFLRMYQVVCGDEDLTIVQSGFIERAVERNQAKKFNTPTGESATGAESTFKRTNG